MLVLYVLSQLLDVVPYDDAFFFKRFAIHALKYGVFAWNVEDGPVYGLTSQLYQFWTAGVTWLDPSHVVVWAKVFAALCVLVTGFVIAHVASDPGSGGPIVLLGLASPVVLATIGTGMETAMTMLLLSIALKKVLRDEQSHTSATSVGLTLLVFLCRPDAAVIPVVAALVVSPSRGAFARRFGLGVGVGVLVLMAGAWAYYGTPVPLAFFAKTAGFHGYGAHMAALNLASKREHLVTVGLLSAPLWVLAFQRRDRTNVALLSATIVFWLYHGFFTQEIMGYRGRFYAPGLVPLTIAAARSWGGGRFESRSWKFAVAFGFLLGGMTTLAYVNEWCATQHGDPNVQIVVPTYAAVVAMGVVVTAPLPSRVATAGVLAGCALSTLAWLSPRPPAIRSDKEFAHALSRQTTSTRGLFILARCFEDLRTVYHSEMGVTGEVLSEVRLVDLAGILSRTRGVEFDEMCAHDRPEAIFLPHANYVELNDAVKHSDCLRGYQPVVERSSSPLFVRNNLVDRYRRCLTEAAARR